MMKDLLKDAAFLADPERGIRQFCEPPPRGRWSESRHAAAKPIKDGVLPQKGEQVLHSRLVVATAACRALTGTSDGGLVRDHERDRG